MLKRLVIRNFRSIAEADLDLGSVNLFIGPNGSGKSNILEAIGVLSAALGRSVAPEDLDLRGVRLSLPRLFKSTFKNRKIPNSFSIEASFASCHYSFTMVAGDESKSLYFRHELLKEDNAQIFGRGPNGVTVPRDKSILADATNPILLKELITPDRGLFDTFLPIVRLTPASERDLTSVSKYAIFAPQTAVLRGLATDSRPVAPLGLTGGRLGVALQEALAQMTGPSRRDAIRKWFNVVFQTGWVQSLRSEAPRADVVPPQVPQLPNVVYFVDKFMHTHRSFLSAYDASEGALYLLFVATLLAHKDAPRVFALDNVDGTLNPGLVRQLVAHIVELVVADDARQVFMTSHNPTALDAIDLLDDKHRVYVVQRDETTGYTKFVRLAPKPSMSRADWIAQVKGRSLSNLWIDGLIPGALNL